MENDLETIKDELENLYLGMKIRKVNEVIILLINKSIYRLGS
jgi:hypothetical protein